MLDSNVTVLLIDDDARLLRGLERHLYDRGCTVLTAVSAREAIAILHEKHVDLVVCDNAMPGMTGVTFLAHLAQSHPNVARVVLTGHLPGRDRNRLTQEIHVDAILEKPCEANVLADTIDRVLQQHIQCGKTQ
jgi:DNA-binding NtrC family response regulator